MNPAPTPRPQSIRGQPPSRPPTPPSGNLPQAPEFDPRTTIFLQRPLPHEPALEFSFEYLSVYDFAGATKSKRVDLQPPLMGNLVRICGPFQHGEAGAGLTFKSADGLHTLHMGTLCQAVDLPRGAECLLWLGMVEAVDGQRKLLPVSGGTRAWRHIL